ncbi:MAG: hypothetical protein WEA10_00305 [Actinomycetota bacterium]
MAPTTKKRFAVLAGIVIVGVTAGVAAQAATTGSAPINRFDAVDEIVEECTNTTNFNVMPQMKRSFTVAGSVAEEAVVMFEGSLSLSDSGGFDTGFLRLTVDGVEQSPGLIPTLAEGDRGTHGFNWHTTPLSPGSHTARIQWRTDLGETFCADARSLIVIHK